MRLGFSGNFKSATSRFCFGAASLARNSIKSPVTIAGQNRQPALPDIPQRFSRPQRSRSPPQNRSTGSMDPAPARSQKCRARLTARCQPQQPQSKTAGSPDSAGRVAWLIGAAVDANPVWIPTPLNYLSLSSSLTQSRHQWSARPPFLCS